MINAWSLAYDVINGTMDENFPVKKNEEPDDTVRVSAGSTHSETTLDFSAVELTEGMSINQEYVTGDVYTDTLNVKIPDDMPSPFTTLSDNDDAIAHLIDKPVSSGIEDNSPRKYKEDESIEALKNYISTTYGGHYTSDNNSVQTLDLIESVGDAEAFCRSNAIKYLTRYDKKGQAKRDILKALHYSLLLYHFSGQLNETPTRGYETF